MYFSPPANLALESFVSQPYQRNTVIGEHKGEYFLDTAPEGVFVGSFYSGSRGRCRCAWKLSDILDFIELVNSDCAVAIGSDLKRSVASALDLSKQELDVAILKIDQWTFTLQDLLEIERKPDSSWEMSGLQFIFYKLIKAA